MQHRATGLAGGGDQSGDPVQGAGRAYGVGQFGKRAAGADDSALAFDGEQRGDRRIEQHNGPLVPRTMGVYGDVDRI